MKVIILKELSSFLKYILIVEVSEKKDDVKEQKSPIAVSSKDNHYYFDLLISFQCRGNNITYTIL